MRITFKDVRIENEKTYFFLNCGYRADLKYCLERDGITDYEFVAAHRYRSVLPESVTVPTIRIQIDEPDSPVCKRGLTCVLISHMNTDDLLNKLRQIQNNEDDELDERNALIITKAGTGRKYKMTKTWSAGPFR